jgi:hypothetical protein
VVRKWSGRHAPDRDCGALSARRNFSWSGAPSGAPEVADAEYHGREYTPVAYEIAKVKSIVPVMTAKFVTPEDFGFVHDIAATAGPHVHAGRLRST